MSKFHIIYASTSGHTEYAVGEIVDELAQINIDATSLRVEQADETDLTKGDVLVLASSTWNTGGPEGQLNPHMFYFLLKKMKATDLAGKKVVCIGLGDSRYRYTCKAAEKLEEWVIQHGGEVVGDTLKIVNEPYGQEKMIREWAQTLPALLS